MCVPYPTSRPAGTTQVGSALVSAGWGSGYATIAAQSQLGANPTTAKTDGLVMALQARSGDVIPYPTMAGNVRPFKHLKITANFQLDGTPTYATAAIGWNTLLRGWDKANYAGASNGWDNQNPHDITDHTTTETDPAGPTFVDEPQREGDAAFNWGTAGNILEIRSDGSLAFFTWSSGGYILVAYDVTAPTKALFNTGSTNEIIVHIKYSRDTSSPYDIQSERQLYINGNEVTSIFGVSGSALSDAELANISLLGQDSGGWSFGGANQTSGWDNSFKGFKWSNIKVERFDQSNDSPLTPTFSGTARDLKGAVGSIWEDDFARDGVNWASRKPAILDTGGSAITESASTLVLDSLWATQDTAGSNTTFSATNPGYPAGFERPDLITTWADGGTGNHKASQRGVVRNGIFGVTADGPRMSPSRAISSVVWDAGSTGESLAKYRDLFLIKPDVDKQAVLRFSAKNRYPKSAGGRDNSGVGLLLRVQETVAAGGEYGVGAESTVSKINGYYGRVYGNSSGNGPDKTPLGGTLNSNVRWEIGRYETDGTTQTLACGHGGPVWHSQYDKYWDLMFQAYTDGTDVKLSLRYRSIRWGYDHQVVNGSFTELGNYVDPNSDSEQITAQGLAGIEAFWEPDTSGGTTRIDAQYKFAWFDLNNPDEDEIHGADPYGGPDFQEPPLATFTTALGAGVAPFLPVFSEVITYTYDLTDVLTESGARRTNPAYEMTGPRKATSVTWLVSYSGDGDGDVETLLYFLKGCRDHGKSFKISGSDFPAVAWAFATNRAPIKVSQKEPGIASVGPVKLIEVFPDA